MKSFIKFILMLILSLMLSLLLFYKMTNDGLLTKICGFGVLRIESGSMENELSVGDIIIIKECEKYEVNDIVTYNVNDNYLVTHRIIEKEGNNFVTKGDNNNTKDIEKVTKENIEGKMIFNSKLLRLIYEHWLITIIVVLFILIILL